MGQNQQMHSYTKKGLFQGTDPCGLEAWGHGGAQDLMAEEPPAEDWRGWMPWRPPGGALLEKLSGLKKISL